MNHVRFLRMMLRRHGGILRRESGNPLGALQERRKSLQGLPS